ncbi:hypothetical protein MG290_14765 (plasmid) [Flavobacterium sp. CBA20B-1]|uniref:DnaB-like helicase C-terminal domain-containing protein n=1 Tax=unclassified Flavobacterium TaxID=196869 RepID=UPI0022242D16|nr:MULTISPECIES: DnaB-like helicase C-terminal domain-containing protein [unclassified Flavobacterium]WCM43605.1 hypothetical protein MG290_14765 [Flavobacterium sp. CBA20B-1]
MSALSLWIEEDLYPAIYEKADQVYPEHNFIMKGSQWISNTYLNGTPSNRKDKTYIGKKLFKNIAEQGGKSLSHIDYQKEVNNLSFIEAIKYLASVCNLEIPKGDYKESEQRKKERDFFNVCNSYFTYSLNILDDNHPVKQYLFSRSYSNEVIEKMGLGYIASKTNLFNYLANHYSREEIEELLKTYLNHIDIGDVNVISIPFTSNGNIKGFVFRAVSDNYRSKYIYSNKLEKDDGFFNMSSLKGEKDLIIVEGQLDALFAEANGIDNIVASGHKVPTPNQIKNALTKSINKITLVPDFDPGKEVETSEDIIKAIYNILDHNFHKIFIAEVSKEGNEKVDVDSFIRNNGIDNFKQILQKSVPYYVYIFNSTISKFAQKENNNSYKLVDDLLEELLQHSAKFSNPIHREAFKNLVLREPVLAELGINKVTWDLTIEKLSVKRNEEIQKSLFEQLNRDANVLHKEGKTTQAISLIETKLKDIKIQEKQSFYESLIKPISENDLLNHYQIKPGNIQTQFSYYDESDKETKYISFPSGAISIIAAPTSHGKTSFMLNSVFECLKHDFNKEIHIFSFEEDKESILISLLNCYLDKHVSKNNKRTIEDYFRGNKYILNSYPDFEYFKNKFFENFVLSQKINIHYVDYDSQTLIDAIYFLRKNRNVGAVFIDYIQLLKLPENPFKKNTTRQEEIKQICLDLKDISVLTGLPVILGAQLSREVKNPSQLFADKIREAGDIEHIANLIIGFWNCMFEPQWGGVNNKIPESYDGPGYPSEELYCKIIKNRGGKPGDTFRLSFEGNTGKVKTLSFY